MLMMIMFQQGVFCKKFDNRVDDWYTGMPGKMERECEPRRGLLIQALQDEPRRDQAPDRGVLSGLFLVQRFFYKKKIFQEMPLKFAGEHQWVVYNEVILINTALRKSGIDNTAS